MADTEKIGWLLTLLGGGLLALFSLLGLVGMTLDFLTFSNMGNFTGGIIGSIIGLLLGALVVAIEIEKLPPKLQIVFKPKLMHGIVAIVVSVITGILSLTGILLLVGGILYLVAHF
jgi:hypothetical protein